MFAAVVIIIELIIAIIAIAMMPKPKQQKPTKPDTPTVQDGQSVLDVFGTVWVDDSFIQAWMQTGPEPIKSSGGK